MGASSESRRLRKKPAVCQRRRKVRVCLAFDDDAGVDLIVTARQPINLNVEGVTCPCEIDQGGLPF